MAVLTNTRFLQIVTNTNPFRFVSDDGDLGQVHRVHLKTLIVPNTEYNVNSKTDGVSITAADMIAVPSVPQGQYSTLTAYLDALKVVLDVAAAPNTFAITQNPLTNKLTFVKSAGAEFTIAAESEQQRLIGQSRQKTSVGLSLTCDAIFDLSGMRNIVIQSFTLGKFLIAEGDTPAEAIKSVVLGTVSMDADFGNVLKRDETEETLNYASFAGYKNISSFDVSLVDEFGLLLELNNAEWLLQLEVHIQGAR
jgi:hypothetical protein